MRVVLGDIHMDKRMRSSLLCSGISSLDVRPVQSLRGGEDRAKILIVDDDPVVHMLYGRCLERAGYHVIRATNGREAIEIATREQPRVVIMDIMMPEMDGLASLRALKKAHSPNAALFIMVTANPLYDVCQHESKHAGACRFMTKPFSPEHLLEQVRDLLASQQSQSEGC